MPLFFFDVITDGEEDRDTEGLTLDHVGEARAQVVVMMIELRREVPRPGEKRVVTVTARDDRGVAVYTDQADMSGSPVLGSDAAALHRALGVMDRRL